MKANSAQLPRLVNPNPPDLAHYRVPVLPPGISVVTPFCPGIVCLLCHSDLALCQSAVTEPAIVIGDKSKQNLKTEKFDNLINSTHSCHVYYSNCRHLRLCVMP